MGWLKEHEEECQHRLRAPYTLAHRFLDQFAASYKETADRTRPIRNRKPERFYAVHRQVLHNDVGLSIIEKLFGEGHAAAASLHIKADNGQHVNIPVDIPVLLKNAVKRDTEKTEGYLKQFPIIILALGKTGPIEAIGRAIKEECNTAGMVIVIGGYTDEKHPLHTCTVNSEMFTTSPFVSICGHVIFYRHNDSDIPEEIPLNGSIIITGAGDTNDTAIAEEDGRLILHAGHSVDAHLPPSLIRLTFSPQTGICEPAILDWDPSIEKYAERLRREL